MNTNKTKQFDIETAAAALKIKGGRNGLYRLLREMDIFVKTTPRRRYIQQGLFRVQEKSYQRGPVAHPYIKTLVTADGMAWLTEVLADHQAIKESPQQEQAHAS